MAEECESALVSYAHASYRYLKVAEAFTIAEISFEEYTKKSKEYIELMATEFKRALRACLRETR